MKLAFIVNPISGKKIKGQKRIDLVERFVAEERIDTEVLVTQYPGHATELARISLEAGVDRIVCVGGDGTINEVAKELIGNQCELALVPMGSGNGLARHLGLPLKTLLALKSAISGRVRRIDTGEANGHPFVNVMGFGLDAAIGQKFNETKGRGFLNYLKEGMKALFTFRSNDYMIESDGSKTELNAYLVAIANSSQYGNNAYIAPDASLQDGKLNLVAVRKPGLFEIIALIYRLFAKKVYQSKCVTPFCSERFTLKVEGESIFHADGEIFDCDGSVSIRTLPASLKIVVPSLA